MSPLGDTREQFHASLLLDSLNIPEGRLERAISRAAPHTFAQMRTCVSGFLCALDETIDDRTITEIASVQYDALPWRAHLIAAE